MIGGRRRNVFLLWKLCLIQSKECDPQRTTFPSFENQNIIHYVPPNIIPRFQSQVFSVKDEAAIQSEAQEMHFENMNKEGVRQKTEKRAGLSKGGGYLLPPS